MAGSGSEASPLAAAYGFRIDGLPTDPALAVVGAGGWPTLRIEQRSGTEAHEELGVFEDTARLRLAGGSAVLDRLAASATFVYPHPLEVADLVHPCLWPAAGVFARWHGRETLHAGAFLDEDGSAWAILGNSGDGKSSFLAALARAGRPILVDDLLVIDNGQCFAGPRCLDLRADAAVALGLDDETTLVRATSRRRIALPAIAGRVPLRGLVYLTWGTQVAVEVVAPAARIGRLARHRRVIALGVEPVDLLDLGRLPAFELRRPRRWRDLPTACSALLDAVNASR